MTNLELSRETLILLERTSTRQAKKTALNKISTGLKEAPIQIHLLKALLHAVSEDPSEVLRETSAEVVLSALSKLDALSLQEMLQYILPVLVSRLGSSNRSYLASLSPQTSTVVSGYNSLNPDIYALEHVEKCEEVRLILVKWVRQLVECLETDLHVRDSISILSKCLLDPFPEVKKEACEILVLLCTKQAQSVSLSSKELEKPVLSNLIHKHSAIRHAALLAFGSLMSCDASALEDAATLTLLSNLTRDASAQVRLTLINVVGRWMVELRDRYGLAWRLLPLLFAGMSDNCSANEEASHQWMDKCGKGFEEAFEDQVKDYKDYLLDAPDRPRIGSRVLVRDNIQKMLETLLRDVGSWSSAVPPKALQTLLTLLTFAEINISGYSSVILSTLVRMTSSELLDLTLQVARKLSFYVDLQVLLSVIQTQLESNWTLVHFITSHLLILTAIFEATQTLTQENLSLSIRLLKRLDGNRDSTISAALIPVYNALLKRAFGLTILEEDGRDLFYSVLMLSDDSLMLLLSKVLYGEENLEKLYQDYIMNDLLLSWSAAVATWQMETPDLHHFEWILKHGFVYSWSPAAVQIILEMLAHLAVRTLEVNGKVENDYRIRLVVLEALVSVSPHWEALILDSEKAEIFIRQICLANMVWRAGKRAEAARAKAVLLLKQFVSNPKLLDFSTPILLADIASDTAGFWNILSSCLDDQLETRRHTLSLFSLLLEYFADAFRKQSETCRRIYPELLKRLDDANDELRKSACKALHVFYSKACCPDMDPACFEMAVKMLFVHMDDVDSDIQDACMRVVRDGLVSVGGSLPLAMVEDAIAEARQKHRSIKYLDQIKLN